MTNTTARTTDTERSEQARKKLLERIEGASNDLYSAYEILDATVKLLMRETKSTHDLYLLDVLSADRNGALALSKRLGAIADFSDTTEKMYSALYCLVRNGALGIGAWNAMCAVVDAVDALDERDVGSISATDADTGDERTIYSAATCSPQDMFAHVTELRYHLAHHLGAVDPAGPLCADLARFRTERTGMLSTYNALLEYAPNDLRISDGEYNRALTALNMAVTALGILIAQGETLAHADSADEAWHAYCDSAEAVDAKTAILSAYVFCPIDVC